MYFQKLSQYKQMIEKQSVCILIYRAQCFRLQSDCYNVNIHIEVFYSLLQLLWNVTLITQEQT